MKSSWRMCSSPDAIPEAERLDLIGRSGADISSTASRARIVSGVDGIVQLVAPEMRSGDVVAILSNGGFGGIYEKLPAALEAARRANSDTSTEASAKA